MVMAKKVETKINCIPTFTPGAIDRITQEVVCLYYRVKNGDLEGPPQWQERIKALRQNSDERSPDLVRAEESWERKDE